MRRLLQILSRLVLGSLIATRTGAAPIPAYELEAKVRDEWRKVRHETLRDTLLTSLPEEVRQYLPGETQWDLDLPTSIRLSYAAARSSQFDVLDDYWSLHPEVSSDSAARKALEETRNWLTGKDGLIERAEQRQSTEIAVLGAAGPTAEFISPFEFVWPAVRDGDERQGIFGRYRGLDNESEDSDDGDDDDDDDCDDDDCYDG